MDFLQFQFTFEKPVVLTEGSSDRLTIRIRDNLVAALTSGGAPEGVPARQYAIAAGYQVRMMDEAYRILRPGGEFHIHVPSASSHDGFRDPTHRRFFVRESFWYFDRRWRESRGLGHYLCACDFAVDVRPVISPTSPFDVRPDHDWNVVHEWRAVLTSRKGA